MSKLPAIEPAETVHIQLPLSAVDWFTPVFGAGVGIFTQTGIPLVSLLCDQLGIHREYVDQRIQTIFVNGRAVDHPDRVRLSTNAVVALSAAMPGLVGATFRKQGLLAGLRKDISHLQTATPKNVSQPTVVTLKLFNLVAKEIGPDLLQRRIWVKGPLLADVLKKLFDEGGLAGGAVVRNDKTLSKENIKSIQWPDDWVVLEAEISK